jgi:hypothetical protein
VNKNRDKLLGQTALVLPALCAMAIALSSCGRSPSYFGVLKHDKEYYAAIAESCSNLLSQTNEISKLQVIKGDDKSLPAPLLDLHATEIKVANRIQVGTNYDSGVSIIFGKGRPDFVIAWYQNDYGNGHRPWELAVNGDGPHTVVYSADNP